MSDFMFLFRASLEAQRQAMGTPERAKGSMDAWMTWVGQLSAGGHLKDRGQPLETGGRLVRGAAREITDGPFMETKDVVLGFMIVQARDLAAAVELSRGCPMLNGGGAVEVRPVASLTL
jgi:hypothetical protein